MGARSINLVVIHCTATPAGRWYDAARCDADHKSVGFKRDPAWAAKWNPATPHIGYHFLIGVNGALWSGRAYDEVGAHVRGYNANSLGVAMAGVDKFTPAQWRTLRANLIAISNTLVERASGVRGTAATPREAFAQFNSLGVRVVGHRDLSPDLNGDGEISPCEYIKRCPTFDVKAWLTRFCEPLPEHVLEEAKR